PAFDMIIQIASECFMPVAYGGGISTVEQMRRILNSGVEKIILNSVTYSNPDVVRQAAREFGSQAVIASIDVKQKLFGGYEVLSHSGTRKTGHDPVQWAKRMEQCGAGEILLNAIDRDGMMNGYDLDLVSRVAAAVSIPVIASGGAGSASDFAKATEAGAGAVSAGAMFVFFGPHRAVLITYPTRAELTSVGL
ncbi:MAG: HisA/HisF-related TIM barrel protein, partial [Allorhizobium sp.]